ncbi:MAG TPA: hydrolase [Sphingobacteriaceae bacterium]|nr:hydrolase [Sphingobacteriaceae bacterium]
MLQSLPIRSNSIKNLLSTLLQVIFCLLAINSSAQKKNDSYELKLKAASSDIKIDGIMDEAAWRDANVATNFFMVQPLDTSFAKVRTDVRMSYDKNNLYIIAICYHEPGPYFVESLRRDFGFNKNDNFLLFMDPFDDQTNGFSFGANAAGAQWDGIMYDGSKVDLSWDNKWVSAVKNYDDRWVFEAAIPFKSIRYKQGITKWGINFSRMDLKSTEKSSWARVPKQFPTAALAYSGNLVWDQPPPAPGQNISIIPFTLGGISNDYSTSPVKRDYRKEIGADVKIALTSSMNLDLTVNPDYSQVDVDQQIPNLDRYELFFPEKRQYFLENGDLFSNFGYADVRPFFSRRIGLGAPIQFGARLSGKLNKDWRLGIMDMQTSEVNASLPSQNFASVALQRRVFARSNIGAIFINKQSLDFQPANAAAGVSRYNRNAGIEYNLASSNNMWTGKTVVLESFSPGKNGHNIMQGSNLQYVNGNWNLSWQHEVVGRNYNAEVGYVPRAGYVSFSPQASYLFFPKKGNLVSHGPKIYSINYFDESFNKTDHTNYAGYNLNFRSRAVFTAWAANDYVKILQPFDPTNMGATTLAIGSEHHWSSWGTAFVSKPQSLFTYSFSTRYGGYYAKGTRLNITSELGYRFQPYVSMAISSSYNDIHLPAPWEQTTFWLIGPRLNITMTNKVYFTGFVQYNEQKDNINVNTRLQWRYKPASDLFIVYTDNYLPGQFTVKNRFLVLKFTYWWNI